MELGGNSEILVPFFSVAGAGAYATVGALLI
jgi:hypothetical protein